jgi:hypothetical protein
MYIYNKSQHMIYYINELKRGKGVMNDINDPYVNIDLMIVLTIFKY